ncbi:MAG: nicotinate-nucleotide--dimethylbenzimidazole phosphoribosyltransferase [Desulfatibacillaceae bacterium]
METHEAKLKEVINDVTSPDTEWLEKARDRTSQLVMPPRALGRLHEISERLCSMGRTLSPRTDNKAIVVMAGDHGVVEEGVSAFPREVTMAMLQTFLAGGAGINAMAKQVDADVYVADIGVAGDFDPSGTPNADHYFSLKVARGTENFCNGPAMTREQAARAVLAGYEVADALFDKGLDILGTGDMGIGNTTPSAAVGCVICGSTTDIMVGRGTGVDDEGLARKRDAVRRAIELNKPEASDGLDVLGKVGGYEIGGIAGLCLAAARRGKPVVVDGFISTAGALIAATLCPEARQFMFSGHQSEEVGHRTMLAHLGLDPILDLGMRLGEGTGGAVAMGVIDAAARMIREVFTFEEANIM